MKRSHAIKLRDMMHKAAVSLPDDDDLEAVELFPAWCTVARETQAFQCITTL